MPSAMPRHCPGRPSGDRLVGDSCRRTAPACAQIRWDARRAPPRTLPWLLGSEAPAMCRPCPGPGCPALAPSRPATGGRPPPGARPPPRPGAAARAARARRCPAPARRSLSPPPGPAWEAAAGCRFLAACRRTVGDNAASAPRAPWSCSSGLAAAAPAVAHKALCRPSHPPAPRLRMRRGRPRHPTSSLLCKAADASVALSGSANATPARESSSHPRRSGYMVASPPWLRNSEAAKMATRSSSASASERAASRRLTVSCS
mmetsp:Transcript_64841/g.200816  ORF Transcript_64841/g.200816 Transcript_64841/m.200816 type:complete len:260 (-) Transcript_64841:135-914(-)